MRGEKLFRAVCISKRSEGREEGAVEQRGHADGFRVGASDGAFSGARTRDEERADDLGGDEWLVADHQDEGIERRADSKQVGDAGADGTADAALPFGVMAKMNVERSQLLRKPLPFVASDDDHRRATSAASRSGGADNQRFAAITHELLWPA